MTTYCVITKVPDNTVDRGNLANAFGQVFFDPQAKGPGRWDEIPEPLGKALGNPLLDVFVLVPVFKLGELLIIDHNDRDQFTRKPSKWNIEYEEFQDIDAAVARMREVTREAQ